MPANQLAQIKQTSVAMLEQTFKVTSTRFHAAMQTFVALSTASSIVVAETRESAVGYQALGDYRLK